MKSQNRVTILGHVGEAPKVTKFEDGGQVANFSIATNRRWTDKETGEAKESTEWHNVVAWGGLSKVCEQYVGKGSRLYIEGHLQTRTYERDGQTHYVTEIFLDDLSLLDKAEPKNGQQKGQGAA